MSGSAAAPSGERQRRALVVAYDGAPFSGWQIQPDRPTVQAALESALTAVSGETVRVVGAGRTDAGVHARGQVAHFDDVRGLPAPRLQAAVNAALPASIRVRRILDVPPGFHALHSARDKTYVYALYLSSETGGLRAVESSVPPLLRGVCHAVRAGLDLTAMRAAAARLVGTRDFTALSKAMPEGRGTVKTLQTLRVLRRGRWVGFVGTADGFLYGMMRLLAGLLVEVGSGIREAAAVEDLLASADRSRAPASLPAHGLHLVQVRYVDVSRDIGPIGLLS